MTRSVLILEKPQGPWCGFLREYFSDTPAEFHVCHDPGQAMVFFDRIRPDVFFSEPGFLNRGFLQKISVWKNTRPASRLFLIGDRPPEGAGPLFDEILAGAPNADFGRRFVEKLPLPGRLRLLVVDDEEEVGTMVKDYFAGRQAPSFEIECAPNGKEALAAASRQRPDVILLDIKMPVMDGREFYAKIKAAKLDIPVIIFFDSVSGEELTEIRRSGNPAVIEKGYQGSSLSALMTLVKKLVYFST